MRVPMFVVALVAMPLAAGVAQGRGQEENTKCNADQAAAVARARAAGRQVPPGLAKKDCAQSVPAPVPPPPSEQPPSGIHKAGGIVYEDVDGNGIWDMFAGEMGLAGWTLQLHWNGQVVATTTSDANGRFVFPGLGDSVWSVCVVPQAGYNLTQPSNGIGNACGGFGYESTVSGSFENLFKTDFGFVIP